MSHYLTDIIGSPNHDLGLQFMLPKVDELSLGTFLSLLMTSGDWLQSFQVLVKIFLEPIINKMHVNPIKTLKVFLAKSIPSAFETKTIFF